MRYYIYALCIAWNVVMSFYVSRHLLPVRPHSFELAGRRKPYRKNYPRKIKRMLRSSNDTTSFSRILTDVFDGLLTICYWWLCLEFDVDFLKNNASERMYEGIMKKIGKQARRLNITVDPEFGKRNKTIRPTMIEWLTNNGSFTVCMAICCFSFIDIVLRPLLMLWIWLTCLNFKQIIYQYVIPYWYPRTLPSKQ